MKSLRPSCFRAFPFLLAIVFSVAPARIAAQDQPVQNPIPDGQAQHDQAPQSVPQQSQAAPESAPREFWSWLKEGKIAFNARYRLEGFERDGAPFTGTAYAPTLRLMLGYATAEVHGFSLFASGEYVLVTGPADYNDPTRPSQNRPDRPAILDPRSLQLNQGYLQWNHGVADKKVVVTLGRQELALNDGRFLSVSYWRQVHGTFDAARIDAELPLKFSFTYAFINRAYRVVGYDATDGKPPMHTHMWNLKWTEPGRLNVSQYGLLLDYRAPAQFSTSTQTYGLRFTGPYQLTKDWSIVYTAEYAKQKNYGTNPNRVDANYYLGELGPGWRDFYFKAGYALLGGRSPTDKLTTPLAPPFNGWTDLFVNDPSAAGGNGLEARYLYAKGPVPHLNGLTATLIYYDYHSDNLHLHYGSELDSAWAYKVKRVRDRWEIGWRFGRYWSDRLFTPALRTSIYTSFTL
jgi:Alginate export